MNSKGALAFTLPLTLLRHQRIDIETSQPFHFAPASPVKICYISGYNGMPPQEEMNTMRRSDAFQFKSLILQKKKK